MHITNTTFFCRMYRIYCARKVHTSFVAWQFQFYQIWFQIFSNFPLSYDVTLLSLYSEELETLMKLYRADIRIRMWRSSVLLPPNHHHHALKRTELAAETSENLYIRTRLSVRKMFIELSPWMLQGCMVATYWVHWPRAPLTHTR
jgi:hypothetical protein